MWGAKARAVGRYVWRNLDALLVIVAAAVVLAIEVVGSPNPRLIDSVILALLGISAFALLRDRAHQVRLDELQQLAGDAMSDRAYEVVWQENEWDIRDRANATIRVTEQLRITHDEVATIAHWSRGDGEDTRNDARWRRSDKSPWIDAKAVYEFPVRNGRKVIYCFDEEHRRGDMLEWCIERDAVGRFPTEHEGVELKARTRSDHPRVMRILWPAASPPSHVEIRHGNHPARTILPRKKNGRLVVEEKIAGLAIGESVELAWTW